jgi:hypothetical protein
VTPESYGIDGVGGTHGCPFIGGWKAEPIGCAAGWADVVADACRTCAGAGVGDRCAVNTRCVVWLGGLIGRNAGGTMTVAEGTAARVVDCATRIGCAAAGER